MIYTALQTRGVMLGKFFGEFLKFKIYTATAAAKLSRLTGLHLVVWYKRH